MLRYMRIQNLAVIDQAELEVGNGFICLTGESGAGKSVLIDAILLLSGGRAASDLVRTGCEKAVVEAEFTLDGVTDLEALAAELELIDGEQLFLRREVTRDGKSRAFVNGTMVPAGVLSQYGDLAFEIHGQHGQQRLLKPKFHQRVFEEQSGLAGDAAAFEEALQGFRTAFRTYWELVDGEAERLKEIDFATMQLKEIDEVQPNEADADLDQRLKVARNSETIRSSKERLAEVLGRKVLPGLGEVEKLVEGLSAFLPELAPYLKEVVSVSTSLVDLRAEVQLFDGTGDDKLAELEARESALNRLFLRYGQTLDEVLAERKRLAARVAELAAMSGGLEDRWAALATAYQDLLGRRAALHAARAANIEPFCARVGENLSRLALRGAVFTLENLWPDWPAQLPRERELSLAPAQIQFLFSPNPGEEARPLARVASGGELSRILLALITAFERPSERLVVFDEIDAGLGGETANAVGLCLKGLGEAHQVLCVTHFAQVARYATQQIKIEKAVEDGRTFTRLVSCDAEQRVSELARLMGGDAGAENLREHARAMLAVE